MILPIEEIEEVKDITGLDKVLYAVRKITEEQTALQNELNTLFEEYEQFYRSKIESLEKRRMFFLARLEEYLRRSSETHMSTPNGKIYIRKVTSVSYPDDDTLIKFCKDNGISLRIKESPDKKEIKKYITETGSIPDGYEEKTEDLFYHKVTE